MRTTQRFLDGVLANICATGGILDPVAVFAGLYVSGPTVTPPATVADFTLPDATDMPAIAIGSWAAVLHLLDGRSARDSALLRFRLPSATNAFTAGGWYLSTALTAGNILGYVPFGAPVAMPDQFTEYVLVLRITTDPNGRWDASASFNG